MFHIEIFAFIRRCGKILKIFSGKFQVILASLRAPTHCFLTRSLRDHVKSVCPRHEQHFVHVEAVIQRRVRETKRGDAHRWWHDLIKIFCNIKKADSKHKFQALRTDPYTGKTLFPVHMVIVTCTETLRFINDNQIYDGKPKKGKKRGRRKGRKTKRALKCNNND